MARKTYRRDEHPNARGGVKPERLGSSAVSGRTYKSQGGSSRADSAGYTTSSPGWRREAPAAKKASTGGGGGGGGSGKRRVYDDHKKAPKKKSGGGDRGPRTTSSVKGIMGPPDIPQTQLGGGMSVGGAGAFIPPAIPPSMLSPLNPLHGVPPGLINPNEGTLGTNMPPALQGVPPDLNMPPINNPALRGTPPALQGQPQGPLPPEIQPHTGPMGPLGQGPAHWPLPDDPRQQLARTVARSR